ncbi:hypothetical protein LSTR_LSTR008974 [Laodelphax striatellus]|uniref:Uncharacterized protein n=1 Tax=Laodelphax striatellus TaxID=195883 RepID=A0A482WKZ6_LAOST|nr:hypothetical protein LSTR_LSTR008974 [Laodelphax striatellus]
MSTNNAESPENETKDEEEGNKNEMDDDEEGEVTNNHSQNVSSDYCNPQLPEDISEDVGDKLKGDAIGDTMYSERFVLLVLMKLIKNIQKVE